MLLGKHILNVLDIVINRLAVFDDLLSFLRLIMINFGLARDPLDLSTLLT